MSDLHLFVAQIVFLITRVKLIQRHFVTINMRFHDFRLLMWLEVIRHKEVHCNHFWAHFREEDKKSTMASRHWRLHKFTFGRRCHWRPWRIEERKENEEIAFPAIFPANHHHKRRQYRRTTAGLPPEHHHMGRRFPRPAAHIEDRSHIGHYIPLTHPSTKLSPTSHFLRPLFPLHSSFPNTPHLDTLVDSWRLYQPPHKPNWAPHFVHTRFEAIPFQKTLPRTPKNTTKLSSFVLGFSPLSTTQINFVPSRKLFLRHPFILGTNFPHHSTIITPRFKLHSWEFIKNSGFQKLEGEEAWKGRGA